MHKKIALTALTFLASIALAACSKSPDVTANATGTTIGDTLKIGVNLELTGAVAAYGNAEQDDLTVDSDGVKKYVFRTTFQDSFQGQVLAQYAYSNLNAKKVVLYYDNSSDYAKGIAEEFQEKYQGEIVATATFASGDKDFQSALLTWLVQQIRMMFITYQVIQRKQHFQIKQQNLLQHIKKNTVQNQICLQRLLMTLFT